jgi:hypothetical protein
MLKVDGQTAAERGFPGGAADRRTDVVLAASVPAGRHTIRIENTGADWLVLDRFTLKPYGASLRVMAKANREAAAFWIYRPAPTEKPDQGTVTLSDLVPGRYRVTWWDTQVGREMSAQTVTVARGKALVLSTSPIATDVAGWVTRIPGK